MEASPDPIVTYDMHDHALYVNPAFTNVFGWTYEEVVGRKIDYVPEGARPDTRDILEQVRQGEGFLNFKTQRYDKKRNIIDIDMSIGIWKSSSGEPAGSVVILKDITEQKKAEMHLQRVQKLEAIGTLAGGIAHDFNKILAGISLLKKNHLPKLDLPPGRYLRLDVSDTGLGMDSTLIKKIFDPYFTTKEPDKGTGLGLAVVLSIIEEHKGKIYVYSKPGVGSSFHVYLPIIEECEGQQVLEKEIEIPSPGSETVLLVDDDEVVLRATQGLLTEFGYTVEAFTNSAAAFNTYGKDPNKFDIVVSDTTMPGMTGFDLSKRILALKPEQPIILCSGFSASINREKALAIGIDEYFEKPIITWEIAKVIRSVIDKRKHKN